jgi:probable F420-dependent oxidoreductase
MKLGVVFPQTEIGADPAVIKDYAQTAEGLGYEYLLVFDHVLGANPNRLQKLTGPYTDKDPFHEPFVLFGYLAGLTKKLELVTGVIILPQRQTALVAKQAAEVDVLSGGRLRLGVGIGWNYVEYQALNKNFSNRGQRSEEQIILLKELWTNELVTFHGKYHTIEAAGIKPLPVQRPIPIWFGGSNDSVLRRMARLGDGWLSGGRLPDDNTKAILTKLRVYLAEAGRDPATFGLDPWLTIANHPESEWPELANHWQALGATHLCVNTMRAGFTSPQQHLEAIRRFKEIVTDYA